jgi:hypothetical protein
MVKFKLLTKAAINVLTYEMRLDRCLNILNFKIPLNSKPEKRSSCSYEEIAFLPY